MSQSPSKEPQPQDVEGWVIYCNVSITRRKSYFLVTDPSDKTVFRDRKLWPCIEFLDETGISAYSIAPATHSRPQNVKPLTIKREL